MQPHNVIAHGGKHPFHLVVAAFTEGQTDVRGGEDFQHRRFGQILLIMQLNAFRELLCRVIRTRRLQRDQLGFLAVVAWGSNTV